MPVVALPETLTFLQAKHYRSGRRYPISLIVLHTTECWEKPGSAAVVAGVFHRGEVEGSAHYVHDSAETVQCVRLEDTAFHAKSNETVDINDRSIGVEHAGHARQTAAEWQDDFSQSMLKRSSKLTAQLCRKFGIPPIRLNEDQLRQRMPGITGHVTVSRAFSVRGGHVDPGPHFPWLQYMRLVAEAW